VVVSFPGVASSMSPPCSALTRLYGLGRFSVTLCHEQRSRLFDRTNELRAFVEKNKRKRKLRA